MSFDNLSAVSECCVTVTVCSVIMIVNEEDKSTWEKLHTIIDSTCLCIPCFSR